jgi:hypothetical protein
MCVRTKLSVPQHSRTASTPPTITPKSPIPPTPNTPTPVKYTTPTTSTTPPNRGLLTATSEVHSHSQSFSFFQSSKQPIGPTYQMNINSVIMSELKKLKFVC